MNIYAKLMEYYHKLYRILIATGNTYSREFEDYISCKQLKTHSDLEYWQREFDVQMRRKGL